MSSLVQKILILSVIAAISMLTNGCYTNPQTGHSFRLFNDRDPDPSNDLIIGEAADRGPSHNARNGTTRDR